MCLCRNLVQPQFTFQEGAFSHYHQNGAQGIWKKNWIWKRNRNLIAIECIPIQSLWVQNLLDSTNTTTFLEKLWYESSKSFDQSWKIFQMYPWRKERKKEGLKVQASTIYEQNVSSLPQILIVSRNFISIEHYWKQKKTKENPIPKYRFWKGHDMTGVLLCQLSSELIVLHRFWIFPCWYHPFAFVEYQATVKLSLVWMNLPENKNTFK